ncbi:MAG: prepilin-type N-terminal cleavage/methylation domain-containing protein [Clostridiales bacterium]|nr:prepilin-type N-terminal cleavage/methylation domain-containing protein [Clostridiales bacterium]
MKQKKRGFTLVELVIVIAVIAILAGVMIAVFANVVNKANESAKLQDEKQAEIQQKLEDIEQKLNNQNWLGWEDFENELAAQLAEANASSQAEMKIAIDNALKEYASAGSNTGLTEEQVKTIIERALSGQLTEEQVKQIVTTAVKNSSGSTLTAAEVSRIVSTAVANNLTADQVKTVVNNALAGITTDISTLKANALTEEQIQAMLESYLPTSKDYPAGTAIDFGKLVSGSTVNLTGDWSSATLDIVYDAAKTFTVTGSAVGTVNIKAPAGTVNLYADAATAKVTAIANNSLHIYSKVTSLSVTTGRVVLEKGSVETLTLASASSDAVTLEIAKNTTIGTLAVQGAAGVVTVENNGAINAITGTAGSTIVVSGSGETMTPVNGDNSNVTVNGTETLSYNGSVNVFTAANSGSIVKLTADVTTAIVIPEGTTFVLDLNGHNVTVEGAHAITNNGTLTVKGEGIVDALTHAKAALFNAQGATAILNGGTFTRSLENGQDKEDSGGNSYYAIHNQGTMTINSGVTVSQSGHYSSMLANGWYDGNQNDSHIEAVLIINGGTFEGGLNTIKNDDWGVATINGGTFTNFTQYVVMNWNKLDINGGAFYHGGSTVVWSGYGNAQMDQGILNITGGTFDGTIYKYGANGRIIITGGTFNSDVTTYVPAGYTYDATTGTVSKN